MPITKSAIKKARQDVKSRKHNAGIRDEYKSAAKKVRKLAVAGEVKKAQEALKEAYSKLDKAAKRNILHKNNAARRKSRLSALMAKPQPKAGQPVAEKKAKETKVTKKETTQK